MVKHGELSYATVGCAMAVHRELGPGLEERFYHLALCRELDAAGIPFHSKPRERLVHRGQLVDEFEADIIIDGKIILELKALHGEFAPKHRAQLMCYLKFWRLGLGILMDFGKESLAQERILFTPRAPATSARSLFESSGHSRTDTVLLLADAIQAVYDEQGLGYWDTTYRGLVRAELLYRGAEVQDKPLVPVMLRGGTLGQAELGCFVVDGQHVLRVLALEDEVRAKERATVQAYLRHLGLSYGTVVSFGKSRLAVRRASVQT